MAAGSGRVRYLTWIWHCQLQSHLQGPGELRLVLFLLAPAGWPAFCSVHPLASSRPSRLSRPIWPGGAGFHVILGPGQPATVHWQRSWVINAEHHHATKLDLGLMDSRLNQITRGPFCLSSAYVRIRREENGDAQKGPLPAFHGINLNDELLSISQDPCNTTRETRSLVTNHRQFLGDRAPENSRSEAHLWL